MKRIVLSAIVASVALHAANIDLEEITNISVKNSVHLK